MPDFSPLFRYDVDASTKVGVGGCGDLWRAQDRLFDVTVAIKTIRDELSSNRRAIRSFELEAIAGARLSATNRHVVAVRDVGRFDDWYYLVMEWIAPGPTGRPDISPFVGACSLARARQILLHVTDAVGYAHLRGVVHSDIAPWNILYRESDDLYLLADFGLLKVVERDLLSVPSRSVLVGGRAAFLPPYARNNLDRVSPATDTYALAITFWNLLAGRAVLKHEESVPGVISIAAEQRDAPPEVRQLLVRFVEEHTPDDNVADFVAALLRIPVR